MSNSFIILGLESSCDETAAALLKITFEKTEILDSVILSSIVLGQNNLHSKFGGVVPELAARAHSEKLDIAVEMAVSESVLDLKQIDVVSVTSGPGLIGGVISGVMFAKGFSLGLAKPLIGVNHLAGHALTPRLTDKLKFPYLLLLVSGGHCQFLIVNDSKNFSRIGGTIDDAPGEAFDKVAKILNLGYPGGPLVERKALLGDPGKYNLPRPLINSQDCNLSFSGLKTALRREYDKLKEGSKKITAGEISDLCASFQRAVAETLVAKSDLAMKRFSEKFPYTEKSFAVAGGVAANQEIRNTLKNLAIQQGFSFFAPPINLCTDNGSIIAYAGAEHFLKEKTNKADLVPRPRWPLDEIAKPMLGSGKRGAKA